MAANDLAYLFWNIPAYSMPKPLPTPIDADLLLIGPLGTKFSENCIHLHQLSSKIIKLKMATAKWPFCLGFDVLKTPPTGLEPAIPGLLRVS